MAAGERYRNVAFLLVRCQIYHPTTDLNLIVMDNKPLSHSHPKYESDPGLIFTVYKITEHAIGDVREYI